MCRVVILGFILSIHFTFAIAQNASTDISAIYINAGQTDGSSLATMKLLLDRKIDPSIDVDVIDKELNDITTKVLAMAGGSRDDDVRLNALRAYIYQPGPWNDHRPFSYDMDDPLGHHLPNKLISAYLDTRKGNCVSMPILVLLLGEKLGLEMTLAHAPHHLFVMYRPEGADDWINLETTSGAQPSRGVWIRQNMPMTDKAIESGIYLQPLERDGVFAAMASTVMEHAMAQQRYDDVISIADQILEFDDRNIAAILSKASAYGMKMEIEFHRRYPNSADVPAFLATTYKQYSEHNLSGFQHAENLGWRMEDAPAK